MLHKAMLSQEVGWEEKVGPARFFGPMSFPPMLVQSPGHPLCCHHQVICPVQAHTSEMSFNSWQGGLPLCTLAHSAHE